MIVARGATRLSHKFRVPLLSPLSPFLAHTFSLCVCVLSPQDIHFAAAAACASVLGSSSVCVIKRTGQAQR